MYKCTDLDQAMPIMSETVIMPNESSEELERKSFELQRAVGGRIYSFLMGLLLMYNTNKQDPDTIKRYFTTLPVAGMTRAELKNLSICEFFNICCDKIDWYKCEAYLDPIIKREQNTTILEQILEDIKASIREYLTLSRLWTTYVVQRTEIFQKFAVQAVLELCTRCIFS